MTGAAQQDHAGRMASLASGPILGTLLSFSVSTLISNLLQTLNQSISLIWIGRLLGEPGLAATANGNQVMSLLQSVLLGFAMATMIRIGHHFGAGRPDEARRSFGCGAGWAFAGGCLLGLLGLLLTPVMLHILGAPPESMAQAVPYLRVMFLTLPSAGLSLTLAMSARGAGDVRGPLYGAIVTLAASAVLNPLLILGTGPLPRLGLPGAALAAGLANLAGVAVMGLYLTRRGSPLRLGRGERRWLVPGGTELALLLRNGLPISLHMNLVVGAQLIMIGLVNREGLNHTAAFGVSLQIWSYLQMPSFAICAGITALTAQAIGAGDQARIAEITRTGIRVNTALCAVLSCAILLAIRPIFALFFGAGSPAIPIGAHMQAICIWGYVLTSTMSAMTAVLRAHGAQMVTVVVNLVSLYLVRLAFYFAAYPLLGADALWWSLVVGAAASVVLTRIAFVRGGWGSAGAGANRLAEAAE